MQPRNAIVTGASHGIGPYIARALAARRMNLLLVARSQAELARLATELRTRGTNVAVAAIDLGGRQAAHQVAEAAAAKDGLTAFSRVLHSDYRNTGVSATSLILGPVKDAG